jgi:hypothetical protein
MLAVYQLQQIGQGRKLVRRYPPARGDARFDGVLSCQEKLNQAKYCSRNLPAHVANSLTNHTDHNFALLIALLHAPSGHAESAKIACELHDVL